MKYDIIFKFPVSNLNAHVETNNPDDIFCNSIGPGYVPNSPDRDPDFDVCDRKQYIFSTMDTPVWCMYPNGYTSQIRRKTGIRTSKYFIKRITGREDTKGVFIVEYLLYYRESSTPTEVSNSIVERFRQLQFVNYSDRYNYPEEILRKICSSNRSASYNGSHFTFRLTTFIPEQVIHERGKVYHVDSGLVVGFGRVTDRIMHPCNENYIKEMKKLSSDAQNFVEIEVVDHNSNKEYWTKVGNKVIRIEPTRDPTKEEGCNIDFYINKSHTETRASDLPHVQDQGIFHTKEDAEAEGNLDAKFKILEMENKAKSIENEKVRLTQEVTKLENENTKLQIEKTKLLLEKYKIDTDFKLTREKCKHEMHKLVLEVTHIKDKLTLFKYSAVLELIKKKMDFEYNIKMKQESLESNQSTDAFDRITSAQNMLAATLKTTKIITDMF